MADALGKIWREMGPEVEWIADADLKDYFGSGDHEKLMTLSESKRATSGSTI